MTDAMPPTAQFDGVSRTFPGTPPVDAVRDMSLTVAEGEFVALTGPSGSGKSTVLNMLAGLDRPTSGRVLLMGRAIQALSESDLTSMRRRLIGLVFQDAHLLPGLTALENVMIGSLPWTKRKLLIAESRGLLAAVGLSDRMDHPPARLSGGERQRVAIARALVGRRPILLADEPTGNLDAVSTSDILAVLSTIRVSHGLTVVVATHDASVARAVDRIIPMSDGKLAADGNSPG